MYSNPVDTIKSIIPKYPFRMKELRGNGTSDESEEEDGEYECVTEDVYYIVLENPEDSFMTCCGPVKSAKW